MGGVIVIIAVGLRFISPESPRYYSDIQKDLRKAAVAVKQVGVCQTIYDQSFQFHQEQIIALAVKLTQHLGRVAQSST
ncbi:hypothetical protein VM1G_11964 [Cytospora mali]|uniref:Uncharacterized protein n=1 Tax=Cytospora mali TaxID=578113 RepID=A0A194WCI6_CYTMA|nr:hypothetical protein VM1G_11964 [Valsa mali]